MNDPRTMTEAQLQACVEQLAVMLGWLRYHTRRSKGSVAGFPDLILLRNDRCLAVELKSAKGKPSPEQLMWLTAFDAARIETAVWRPADWHDGTIEAALRRVDRDPDMSAACPHVEVSEDLLFGRRWCKQCGLEIPKPPCPHRVVRCIDEIGGMYRCIDCLATGHVGDDGVTFVEVPKP